MVLAVTQYIVLKHLESLLTTTLVPTSKLVVAVEVKVELEEPAVKAVKAVQAVKVVRVTNELGVPPPNTGRAAAEELEELEVPVVPPVVLVVLVE